MIDKHSFPLLLTELGFTKTGKIYDKTINGTLLRVDFAKGELVYPEADGLTINERQTCNLLANENFVVFECVHRLLEQGYAPQHIELEPKWKLGHGASGGRADVLVKNFTGEPLLLIECKTAGSEFVKAWNKTLQDGGQLFSYAQQISGTQFLCLYASDFAQGQLTYSSHIIAHRDNEKYLEEHPSFKPFAQAQSVEERYAVWRDTYQKDFTTKGLFEANIPAYQIGKTHYTLADLQTISAQDQQGKYHKFATILRQHNVSGRENAFDKLINLFLCKLVDETENPNNLKFYWKGVAYDTHFDLLDRLQQLYQAGMGKFLGESITYIDKAAVQQAMRLIKQNPDATQKAVWALFLQQKFYTNNDFSLIDVHNEKLFYQNAEVLLKILQMWQDIRLTGQTGQSQFLGDMFEGFLDQGVKQSEGQYFTPMPICKFILMSLPLQALVQGDGPPPKAIDYACGSGHFLNELAMQIKAFAPPDRLPDFYKAIYGIEKEYRLSKVAKVSAFMYGQQDIHICYGDALVQNHPAFTGIENGTFDLLVANPPYSVRGFLVTLPDHERKEYQLMQAVDKLDTNNSIETFFIERAQQLLKAGGVAAIILPSSILSNASGIYIKTREILLKYFDFVAIAEFGSGTFGKTGTNTVTLFLRRKATHPDAADHYRERVAQWFGTDDSQATYQDAHLIAQNAAHIGASLADYQTLLASEAQGAWRNPGNGSEYFETYAKKFNASTEVANLYRQRGFKQLSDAEQEAELEARYLAYVQAIEADKLYYFALASEQAHPVLVIRSPSDTKAQKQFLGYDWSTSKGDEGIKLQKDADGHHQTVLYDETDRGNRHKLNALVAAHFSGNAPPLPPALAEFAHSTRLIDMLDFSSVDFDKQFSLRTKKISTLNSQWPVRTFQEVADINSSTADPKKLFGTNDFSYIDISSVECGTGVISYDQKINPNNAPSRARREVKNNYVLFSTVRPNLKAFALLKNIPQRTLASTGFAVLRVKPSIALPKYLYELLFTEFLQSQMIAKMDKGQYPSIKQTDIEVLRIPLPPLTIQTQIVTECEAVDAQVTQARSAIASTQQALDAMVSKAFGTHPLLTLDQIADLSRGASPRPIDDFLTQAADGVAWIKIGDAPPGTKYITRSAEKITPAGAAKSRLVKPGDFIISNSMSVGRPYILGIEGCVHDGWLILANIVPSVDRDYLYYALSSGAAQTQFQNKALGGVVKNLNIDRAKTVNIAVPPLAEQRTIVAKAKVLEAEIANAQATVDAAAALKQAVLDKYL